MAQQTINVGTSPNDGTGTPLRTAFQYTNSNFSELYTAVGPSGNNIVVPGNATITGDLTAARLNVSGATVPANGVYLVATNKIAFSTNSTKRFTIDDFGNLLNSTTATQNGFLQFDNSIDGGTLGYVGNAKALISGGSTSSVGIRGESSVQFAIGSNLGMTLNSTGLGVGGSPQSKLFVSTLNPTDGVVGYLQNLSTSSQTGAKTKYEVGNVGASGLGIPNGTSNALAFFVGGMTSSEERMRIDSSGNVGVGVTPSAWGSGAKMIDLGVGSAIGNSGSTTTTWFSSNSYQNGTNWIYKNSAAASYYAQLAGQHQWFTAASGTLNTTITDFATAKMVLDASGNLMVGTTTQPTGVTYSRATFKSTSADWASVVWNSNATPYGLRIQQDTDVNGTGNEFLICYGSTNIRASIRSNGGIANYSANNVSLSDARAKTDIKPLASYWNKIKSLELVTFKYKDQTHSDDNIGLIAQQVESVAPELVDADGFGETPADGVPLKTIYTTDLYHASIKALQEAMARIEALEAKLA